MPIFLFINLKGERVNHYAIILFCLLNGDETITDIFSARVRVLTPDGKYQWHVEFPKDFGFFSDLAIVLLSLLIFGHFRGKN